MKYIISLLVIAAIIVLSCNTGNKNSRPFSKPGDVVPDEYVINIDNDTTLVTKHGALLKIPKGSLSTSNGNTVTLEIKEAYTIEQMIYAGLTTTSNGEPLSSGGMIYINAKKGQDVKINQPIKVAIPADYLENGMQLFKGVETEDGSINWTEPGSLPENKQLAAIDKGKQLFATYCASCHVLGKDVTGPNLAHFLKRFTGDTLVVRGYTLHSGSYHFNYGPDTTSPNSNDLQKRIRDINPEVWADQDLYACNIRKYNPMVGPIYDLSYDELTSIYQYIQNVSDEKNLPLPATVNLDDCIDSCMQYLKLTSELSDRLISAERKRDNLIGDNGPMTKEERNPQTPVAILAGDPITQPIDFETMVSPSENEAVYYQFSIETFGWFNVDVLLKDINGNQECELFVRVTGEYSERLDIFLIIPEQKIYTKAGLVQNSENEYVFAYTSGKIFLPQNVRAYILAMTENKSGIAFGLHKFTTGLRQEIGIELKASTPEEFNEAVKSIDAEKIKIAVKEAINSTGIRTEDSTLVAINEQLKKAEALRPRNCDCNCGSEARIDSMITKPSPGWY